MSPVYTVCVIFVLMFSCADQVSGEADEDAIECAKDLSFEADDGLKDILSRNEELSEETKCFAKCYLLRSGLMDDAGDMDVDLSFTRIFSDRDTDEDTKSKYVTALDICGDRYDKGGCDFAGNVYWCIMKEMDIDME